MNDWKESFIDYFVHAAKKKAAPRLGVEIEHFILDRDSKKAAPYSGDRGVRQILARLMELYPEARILPDDDFFGFSIPDFTITIEPAAQLEISIAPMESIREIADIYRSFSKDLDAVLAPLGYAACNVGCQPVSLVTELEQIPKRRYDLMNAHFQQTGTGGMEMMRGSASLQVSIDYYSQEDFRRKLQAAYYYGPLLKLLCDNSPSFQGKHLGTHLKRTDIWRRTDPDRCGILPGVFSPSYGFADYAAFLGNMPPIFLKQGQAIQPTGFRRVSELFADKVLSEEEIAHVLSLTFPDVRVKQYLEIRFADSVPYPFIPAYCAVIKGLLYAEGGLEYAQRKIRGGHMSEEDIHEAEDTLMVQGWDAKVYGRPVTELAKELLQLAGEGLPEEERPWLDAFYSVIRHSGIQRIPGEELERLQSTGGKSGE